MSIETKKAILFEKHQVFDSDSRVELEESCSVGNGILRLSAEDKSNYIETAKQRKDAISFFIPASGSGSRMFAFLYKWLENGEETKEIQEFFENIERFPFFSELKEDKNNRKEIVKEILAKYAHLPKGLLPFHRYTDKINTAFQEHVEQIRHFFGKESKIHFTVQKEFEKDIVKNIGDVTNVSFSYQNEETDAYCFDENREVVKEGSDYLRRPAGHGALLENLNKSGEDIIVLKNIDNVQDYTKASNFKQISLELIGVLITFKERLKAMSKDFSVEKLIQLNDSFSFVHSDDVKKVSKREFEEILKRPTRVCGMVKNEGEPGGGPFWIKDEGKLSNQIVEKNQIKFENKKQANIVQKSSHFNPVFIALSKTDIDGETLDLMQYRDVSKYFVVEKNHQGKKIFYRELPGLWNGSMSNWNTIFVEIPLEVFTPVKSVMDLL